MKSNETVITEFYMAFKNRNVKKMQESYADNAVFNDPVFANLNATQVRSMWEMLIKSGKDMRTEFGNIETNDLGGIAEWHAYYTFSATGKKVINHVHSSFLIQDGKIVRQTDIFNFHKWASQALGMPGMLLGWTDFLKRKVANKAKNSLENYMRV